MAVFVDIGIFVALDNADDEFHSRSKELMKQTLKSDFDRIFTSDYIIDEPVTKALVRTKKHYLAHDLGKFIIESPRITKLWVGEDVFKLAQKKFCVFNDKPLAFTDCTSIAINETKGD